MGMNPVVDPRDSQAPCCHQPHWKESSLLWVPVQKMLGLVDVEDLRTLHIRNNLEQRESPPSLACLSRPGPSIRCNIAFQLQCRACTVRSTVYWRDRCATKREHAGSLRALHVIRRQVC